ncbi:serine/arginine repetitive matrix protein 4-like [Pecten maximus]|uniref:serine/arginine repetitive matrix protein 4-like n=1 Tax=Pecten maximus TaxID=6579 RepID=UPI001458F10F|nr:serine/arginine repetitive matrix protein 4-like [Pecten maximus]
MADSCRPVSRHGRYHAPGRNVNTSSRYTDDIPNYSTIDYVDQEDVYQLKQQAVTMDIDSMERPKTSTGRRNRPKSRMGRTPVEPSYEPEDNENQGRPASRRGYTPETYQRHDYDEYSRQTLTLDSQISSDDSSGLSPPMSPAGRQGSPVQMRPSPAGQPRSRESPFGERMSPSNRQQRLSGFQSPGLTPSPQQRPTSTNRYRMSPSENFSRNSPMDKFDRSSGDTSYLQQRHKSSSSKRSSFSRNSNRQDQPHYGNENYVDDSSPYFHERQPSPSANRPSSRQDYDGYYINQDTGYERNQEGELSQGYERQEQENMYQQENKKQRYSARMKSGKKRRPPGSARKKQSVLSTEPESVIENLPTTASMRPTSSLTRYKLLPAIGTPQAPRRDEISLEALSLKTKRLDLSNEEHYLPSESHMTELQTRSRSLYRSESDYSEEQRSKDLSVSSEDPESRLLQDYQGSDQSSNHGYRVPQESSHFIPHKLPAEPSAGETRILLAVRLLDGSRKQRYFRVTDKLEVVLQFAENCINCDLSLYDLVRNMPRVVYTDLNVLVGEADLEDRTVLYLEEKDS